TFRIVACRPGPASTTSPLIWSYHQDVARLSLMMWGTSPVPIGPRLACLAPVRGVIPMITLVVNGEQRQVDVPQDMPLLWVLRDVLGLTGTKFGCGIAQCGACTVHLEGKPVRSCVLPVGTIGARAITTIEAIGATPNGARVQKAWLDLEVIQCGYCQ